jgi:hypothetical protein
MGCIIIMGGGVFLGSIFTGEFLQKVTGSVIPGMGSSCLFF